MINGSMNKERTLNILVFLVIVFHLAVEILVLYISTQQILPSIVAFRQSLMRKVVQGRNLYRVEAESYFLSKVKALPL